MSPEKKFIHISPTELAQRLGIARERLYFDCKQDGRFVTFEMFVDGKDLTPEQEKIALQYLREKDGLMTLGFSAGVS